jgi:soluble lytic murein transglycosylase-like protein
LLAPAAALAQEEVHVDGSVVLYQGATQRMSPGAHPTALILGQHRATSGRHGAASPAPPAEIAQAIHDSAERHQVDEQLVREVAWQESRYRAGAVSPKGARGTMQLMPGTARSLGVDSSDTAANIDGGVVYLGQLMHRYDGDTSKALAAYNAGSRAVDRYGGVPPYRETQGYVRSIMGRLTQPNDPNAPDLSPLKARMGAD